jgi:hypothetical protein
VHARAGAVVIGRPFGGAVVRFRASPMPRPPLMSAKPGATIDRNVDRWVRLIYHAPR